MKQKDLNDRKISFFTGTEGTAKLAKMMAEKVASTEFSLSEKEYQEKKEKYYKELNRSSQVATLTPCKGTLVKTNRKNEDGSDEYQLVAYKVAKAPKVTSSVKVGAGGDVAKGRIYRFGKFKPAALTILKVMRMSIAERMKAGVSIDTFPRKLRKVSSI